MPKKQKPVKVVSITQAGKKARPIQKFETRAGRVRAMLDSFLAPADIALNYKGMTLLLKRGFSVTELAEQFLVSRPSMYRILDKQRTPQLLHPGIVLYINARIDELIVATDV